MKDREQIKKCVECPIMCYPVEPKPKQVIEICPKTGGDKIWIAEQQELSQPGSVSH